MGTYDSFSTIKGKALIVTVSALQHMEETNRPLRGKEFLQPAQDMLTAFDLPETRMVFISNVLSKLAEAGHICKTNSKLYFMTEAQADSFNVWLATPAYQKQLSDTLEGLREYYSKEDTTPTLEELRSQVSQVEPAAPIPAVFGHVPKGAPGDGTERPWEAGYQRLDFTRAYVPMGWSVTFTSPRGQDFQFDVTTGRLIRLSDGKSKKVYDPWRLG